MSWNTTSYKITYFKTTFLLRSFRLWTNYYFLHKYLFEVHTNLTRHQFIEGANRRGSHSHYHMQSMSNSSINKIRECLRRRVGREKVDLRSGWSTAWFSTVLFTETWFNKLASHEDKEKTLSSFYHAEGSTFTYGSLSSVCSETSESSRYVYPQKKEKWQHYRVLFTFVYVTSHKLPSGTILVCRTVPSRLEGRLYISVTVKDVV